MKSFFTSILFGIPLLCLSTNSIGKSLLDKFGGPVLVTSTGQEELRKFPPRVAPSFRQYLLHRSHRPVPIRKDPHQIHVVADPPPYVQLTMILVSNKRRPIFAE